PPRRHWSRNATRSSRTSLAMSRRLAQKSGSAGARTIRAETLVALRSKSRRCYARGLAQQIELGQQEPPDDLGPGVAPGRGTGLAADGLCLAGVGLEPTEETDELARFRRLEYQRVVARHGVVFARHPRACDSPCGHRFETHEAEGLVVAVGEHDIGSAE